MVIVLDKRPRKKGERVKKITYTRTVTLATKKAETEKAKPYKPPTPPPQSRTEYLTRPKPVHQVRVPRINPMKTSQGRLQLKLKGFKENARTSVSRKPKLIGPIVQNRMSVRPQLIARHSNIARIEKPKAPRTGTTKERAAYLNIMKTLGLTPRPGVSA